MVYKEAGKGVMLVKNLNESLRDKASKNSREDRVGLQALFCVKFYFSLITYNFLINRHNNRFSTKLFWSSLKV